MKRTLRPQVTVLSVSPIEEDHSALSRVLKNAHCPDFQWFVQTSSSLSDALDILEKLKPEVVVCERDLENRNWLDLWERAATLPNPPSVIVTSRLADDHLWAEALNLGAYDVLGKPFNSAEVLRTLSQASLRQIYRRPPTQSPVAVRRSTLLRQAAV